MEHTFEWGLTNFSAQYYPRRVRGGGPNLRRPSPALRKPYPSSPVFTTDFESVTANWVVKLKSGPGGRSPETNNRNYWNFHLELLSAHNKSASDTKLSQPELLRIGAGAGAVLSSKIRVKCQLFLLAAPPPPEDAANEDGDSEWDEDVEGNEDGEDMADKAEGDYDDDEDPDYDEEYEQEHAHCFTLPKILTFAPTCTTVELGWPKYIKCRNHDKIREYGDAGYETNDAEEILRNRSRWVDLHADKLNVRVTIKFIKYSSMPPPPSSFSVTGLTENLIADLRRLLASGQDSDLLIIVNSGEDHPKPVSFPVHQFILSFRSPVFRAMLGSGLTEATSRIIHIKDSEPAVVKHLLEFLYTAKLEFSQMNPDEVLGLIATADKYEVADLKEACFQHLVAHISEETSGKLAVTAYLHGADTYHKDLIYEYNAKHWSGLGAKDEFQALVRAHPEAFLKLQITTNV